MKKAIKTINLLTVLLCGVAIIVLWICIYKMHLDNSDAKEKIMAIFTFVLLIPILVCQMSNTALEVRYRRNTYIIISVITLIFGNLISGILMLKIIKRYY